MAPVFGHGRLRLYLLKLLEESPRHGYEVIRLLQDRFLGVYSPSPGTIYPRLARLEEEGLVTHEVIKGKKIYSVTDKGRAELERRMDELAELEDEITASAQEFAREVQEDVRQTVRSLREELTQAARDMRGMTREQAKDAREAMREEQRRAREESKESWRESKQRQKETWQDVKERQRQEWQEQKEYWRQQKKAWKDEWKGTWEDAWTAATGSAEAAARMKLDRALRGFVGDVHRAAHPASLNDDQLTAARALLAETLERLRTEVFRADD
jgi:DNA-binding PadR family transcriptional regulator